jgi:DNA-3-methyladenine glycosylase II
MEGRATGPRGERGLRGRLPSPGRVPDRPRSPRPVHWTAAEHLRTADPVLARCFPPGGEGWKLPTSPGAFPCLARAIVGQQISGGAARSIVLRLRERSGAGRFPSPSWFSSTPESALRDCGLSPQKVRYLQTLSRELEEGRLDLRVLSGRTDGEVVERLTELPGIGRWTAEMFLIFALHRPDVLPVGDLGLRKAVQRNWGSRRLPSETRVAQLGKRWAPYRTYATYALWRSLEPPGPGPGTPKGGVNG